MDIQAIESSSISFENMASSCLSLFNATNDILEKNTVNIEPDTMVEEQKNEKKKFGLSRVKNATKSVAKKFNQMLVKAKSKLIKPSLNNPVNISSESISTQLTDVDNSFEFEEIDLNEVSRFSSQSTVCVNDEWNDENCGKYNLFNNSLNSTMNLNSTMSTYVSDQSFYRSTKDISLNEKSSIHQIFAASIADLRMIYEETELSMMIPNETSLVKPSEVKKIIRKGTPYKMKIPENSSVYNETNSPPINEENRLNKMANIPIDPQNAIQFDKFIKKQTEIETKLKLHNNFDPFKSKVSVTKRVANSCRKLFKNILSAPYYLFSL